MRLGLQELTEESDRNYRFFTRDQNIVISFDYAVLNDNNLTLYVDGTPTDTISLDVIDEDWDSIEEVLS